MNGATFSELRRGVGVKENRNNAARVQRVYLTVAVTAKDPGYIRLQPAPVIGQLNRHPFGASVKHHPAGLAQLYQLVGRIAQWLQRIVFHRSTVGETSGKEKVVV